MAEEVIDDKAAKRKALMAEYEAKQAEKRAEKEA